MTRLDETKQHGIHCVLAGNELCFAVQTYLQIRISHRRLKTRKNNEYEKTR